MRNSKLTALSDLLISKPLECEIIILVKVVLNLVMLMMIWMMTVTTKMVIKMKTNLISRVRRAVVPVSTPCWVCVAPTIRIMITMVVVHLPSFYYEGNDGYGANDDDYDDDSTLTNEKASQLSFRSCPDIAHCSGSPRTQKSSSLGLKK